MLQDYGKRVFQDYDDTESSEKWKIANLRPANRIHLLNEYEVTFQPLASVKWFKGGKVEVIRYTEPPITKTMAELFKL